MVEVQVKVHDKFSVEFKVGYVVKHKAEPNDFALNMWIFVPNSLDINDQTYGSSQFYRDMKSNVRLITPVFLMREIASGQAIPLHNLENSFRNLAGDPSRANIAEYEYQIKMFMSIFKSSVRDEIAHIRNSSIDDDTTYLCNEYMANIANITSRYRELRHIVNVPTIQADILEFFSFGDEFMSTIIERYTFRLIADLGKRREKKFSATIGSLKELILSETAYQKNVGYPIVEPDSPDNNRNLVFRNGVLKKYIESDLFLKVLKKRDGMAMEQFYYSIAAGLSMVFATIIAFSAQQKYGNFTMPLFVALVVSYMLKDRIKDVARYYFAHRLKAKYFDNKTTISIKEQPIGWMKEGMDFITDDKAPKEVMEIRNRSSLLQAENRINDEKIILYRKMVRLDSNELKDEDKYSISGINDIVRLHLSNFILKTDNPEVPLYTIDEKGGIDKICGDKIYYLNFVIQMQHEEQLEYKRFRLVFNRLGIIEIEELK